MNLQKLKDKPMNDIHKTIQKVHKYQKKNSKIDNHECVKKFEQVIVLRK